MNMSEDPDKSPTWFDLDHRTSPGLDNSPKLSRKRTNPDNLRQRFPERSIVPMEETVNLNNPKKVSLSHHLAQAFNNQELQRTKQKYVIAFVILFLIFPAIRVAIVAYDFSSSIKETSGHFSATRNALFTASSCYTTQVLTSITSNCATGGQINFGVFSGTKAGCYCPGKQSITAGDCSSSDCTAVQALPSTAMISWKGISLCGTFANFTRAESCGTGYVQCGTNSFFCVQGASCGISDIELTTTGGAAPSASYTTVTVNTTVKLYYLIDTYNDNQLSSFSINHEAPCVSRSLYHKRVGFDASHPLELVARTGCGAYEETYEIKKVDSYYETSVYDDNSVNYYVVPLLSNYATSQSVNLVANYLPKMNGVATFEKCGNTAKVCTFANNIEKLKNTFDPIFIVLFYVEIFSLILFAIHSLLAHRLSIYPLKGASYRLSCLILVSVFFTVYIGLVVALMVDLNTSLKVNGSAFRSDFQTMAEAKCFVEESINNAFSNFDDYVSRIERQGLFLIGIWAAALLQGIATFVVHKLLGSFEKKIVPV